MDTQIFRFGCLSLAAVAVFSYSSMAYAADQAGEKQLGEMVIKSDKPALPANLPASAESVTAKQIAESVNSMSSSGALMYLPSVHVRERFIGDVNGGLAMRMYGVNSSAETIVYADGLLLSNFLTNSCCPGPRWGVVSPASIDRVDVTYGPFSALYPGNSVGGVVLMTTHMPSKFEAHAQLDTFGENFKLYGTDENFTGVHGAATVGNKSGDWSFWVSGDHLDNRSHPTDFNTATAKTGAAAAAGQYTVVTGAHFDRDIANRPRVLTAATSIDHTVKDNGTFKLAYDFSPSVRATYTFNIWQNTSDKSIDSYLRDANGNTIYGTNSATALPYRYVRIDGRDYTVAAPSVSRSESEYYMHGLSVKSQTGGTWDWEVTASDFNQKKDVTRASSGNFGTTPSSAATAGTVTYLDGTGWQNLDLRGEWRSEGNVKSEHQISFGFHTDKYTTISDQYALGAGNWRTSSAGALTSNSRGVTSTDAIYVQDAWQVSPSVKLVVGGREERWEASNGSNYANGTNVDYQDKTRRAFSPKASLSYLASDDWSLRTSLGRAVRFPTVGELFKNVGITRVGGGNPTAAERAAFPAPYNVALTNDPNLKPETADAWEISAERALANGVWRTSLFGEEKKDALVSQSDITTLPGFSISSVQNVDKVRTYGIETSLQTNDIWVRGLDLSGSITYVHSRIVKNRANPGLEDTHLPLIPVWRASLLAVYHASDALSYSLGWRYSGRQHSGLFNPATQQYPDPNPDVYGGRSTFS
ncbi:MAG TPA: TonB-dependent receptor, partial [Noviherbaspirillum sp.]|nr:TonB-dependent receptor [Noviherbaspirillum sp.]